MATISKPATFYCEKCSKTMKGEMFYSSHNLEKYPEGKLKMCKKCISMHVDNFNPDTYLWILQECDVPYVPEEWNKLLLKHAQNNKDVSGAGILGRYIGKMRLRQFKDYRWKDSAFLQEMANSKIEQTMKRQGYDVQEIARVIQRGTIQIPEEELAPPPEAVEPLTVDSLVEDIKRKNAPEEVEDYFAQISGAEDDFIDDLTDDDRKYLRLKWGKTYKPEEWVRLEQLYEEMMASYDIQGAGHIDTLKLLCKTSLKANQLIDIGDVESYQKMSKVYDNLMKSGHFTAVQNKEENGEFIDSIGELVEMCERQGYIERFYVDEPNDKVDITIKDMQKYTRTLIEQETNLSQLVEQAVRQNMKEDEDSETNEEEIVFDEIVGEITDADFSDFSDFKEEESEEDLEILKMLQEEDF